jgi:hypothetical protein
VQYDRRMDSDSPFPTSVSDGPIGAVADMFAPNVDDVPQLPNLWLSRTAITDAELGHPKAVPRLKVLLLDCVASALKGLDISAQGKVTRVVRVVAIALGRIFIAAKKP